MGRKLSTTRLGAFQDCLAVLEPLDADDLVAVVNALAAFKHWRVPNLRESPRKKTQETLLEQDREGYDDDDG